MRFVTLLAWCIVCSISLADEPAPLEQLLTRAQVSSSHWSHLDGAVLMRGNQPVCAFGVRQIGDQKPQYTYFVLFRELPKSPDDLNVTGPLQSSGGKTKYTVTVAVGKRKVDITHKMELDEIKKSLSTDELSVAGEAIKPGSSRVLVVDLSSDPPSFKAVDIKPPATVIDPKSEEGHLDAVKRLVAEFVGGSKELQALLKAEK